MVVDITGLDKAKVLKALWDHSKVHGLSVIGTLGLSDKGFTIAEAQHCINQRIQGNHRLNFNYVYGHLIKCDITDDEIDPWLYDQSNGEGAVQSAIDKLRKEELVMLGEYNGPVINIEIIGSENNDKIANKFHEAFRGKEDYVGNNVIINKDPMATGENKTGIYVCVDDLKERKDIIDTLGITLKSVKDMI